jgi:hypothetical protein
MANPRVAASVILKSLFFIVCSPILFRSVAEHSLSHHAL